MLDTSTSSLSAAKPVDATSAHMHIGPFELASPVILAPMAGITNVVFRTLCRGQELQRTGTVSGLYVCEMVTTRALAERNEKTMHMTTFAPDENPRNLQLYTIDLKWTYEAAKIIADGNLADHIGMNFGCPVPRVTRKGGGSALPYKRRLFGNIIVAAVKATESTDIPVTVKFRVGIDDEHHIHLDAGHIVAEMGAQAVALHTRTVAQRYFGHADWSQIARLKEHMVDSSFSDIPVLGNDDVLASTNAHKMLNETGCDGVVVGRGCLGYPWLFAQLSAELRGEKVPPAPTLGEVVGIIRRYAELLVEHKGERKGCRDLRKHVAWYLRGYPADSEVRKSLARVDSPTTLDKILIPLYDGPSAHARPEDADGARGRQGFPARVVLPEGWLDNPEDDTVPEDAEIIHSGGQISVLGKFLHKCAKGNQGLPTIARPGWRLPSMKRMHTVYREQMDSLAHSLIVMCDRVGSMHKLANKTLFEAGLASAETVPSQIDSLEDLRRDTEQRVFELLTREAPVAGDPRQIVSGLYIVENISRTGALSVHITNVARRRHPHKVLSEPVKGFFHEMASVSEQMTHGTHQVLIDHDVDQALALDTTDDSIDDIYQHLFMPTNDDN